MAGSAVLPARLRADRRAAPGAAVRILGGAGPLTVAAPVPESPARGRAGRVLAAGVAVSAVGHVALALWLAQQAPAPPDAPALPATEVLLLSGAQFAAMTAPPPAAPPDAPAPPVPVADNPLPVVLPRPEALPQPAPMPAAAAPPPAEAAPDLAALALRVPDPRPVQRAPERAEPAPETPAAEPSMPRVAAAPLPAAAPAPAPRPATADAGPLAPEAPPPPVTPAPDPPSKDRADPKAAPEPQPRQAAKAADAPAKAGKPAAAAGDGGRDATTRARSAGSDEAQAAWLGAIRARIERRKTYPAAAGTAEGRVTLQLTVDRTGRLTALGVVRSSGHALLDAAALRAVKTSGRFPKAPAGLADAAVTFNLPLRFSAGS